MKQILIEELIKAVNGVINKNIDTTNIYINDVSTDTRTITPGSLFIPIIGENFDGHNFIETAFEKGAKVCLSEKDIITDGILIKVSDTKKALRDFAQYYRSLFKIPVVAITGSTGKTTTKDMIASVLSQKYNILKTEGNFNNEIGLPLTIFKIDDKTEVVVLEMGMNNFGEIHNLSKIAKPQIAIITNIGVSHIENLGSRDGILRAKNEIFDYLDKNGIKILNGDDDMLIELKNECPFGKCKEQHFYSLKNKESAYATNIIEKGLNGITATINYFKKSFDVNIKLPGKHMVSNALVATTVGEKFGLTKEQIKKGIEEFNASKMRMDIINTHKYTIINDVYNANPTSMKASLDVLSIAKGRKVAILGDMLELGEHSSKFHYEIGEYAVKKGIDELVFIGNLAKYMFAASKNILKEADFNTNINYFKTQEEFLSNIKNILKNGDNILVKASRSMKFEKTVDKIMR